MVQLQIMMIPIKLGNINSTFLESRSWLRKIYLFIDALKNNYLDRWVRVKDDIDSKRFT